MRRTTIVALLALAPSALFAQSSAQANGSVAVSGSAQLGAASGDGTASGDSKGTTASGGTAGIALTAEGAARFERMRQEARDKQVPEQPLLSLMAEGAAKGATESQILGAEATTLARMETARGALVRGGQAQPSGEEIQLAAAAIAQGTSGAQLEAVARRAHPGQSLGVALATLTQLEAEGMPVGQAVAAIGSKLEAGASDGAIAALPSASASGTATSAVAAGRGAGVAGGATTSVTAAAGGTASVAGSLGSAVGRRP
jgi:hypothetical protein